MPRAMRSLLVVVVLLFASTSRADDFLRRLAATRSFSLGRPTRPCPKRTRLATTRARSEDLTHMVPDPIVREQLELRVVGLFDSVLKK
jgi:hypothetical protein